MNLNGITLNSQALSALQNWWILALPDEIVIICFVYKSLCGLILRDRYDRIQSTLKNYIFILVTSIPERATNMKTVPLNPNDKQVK